MTKAEKHLLSVIKDVCGLLRAASPKNPADIKNLASHSYFAGRAGNYLDMSLGALQSGNMDFALEFAEKALLAHDEAFPHYAKPRGGR